MYRLTRYWLSALSLVLLLSLSAPAGNFPNPSTWKPPQNPSNFKTKHTLYVGCNHGTPFYSQLTDAVAAAQPYTLIKVCAGQYDGGVASSTDYLKIEGVDKPGTAVIDCNLGGDDGIDLYGNYNWVNNLEIDNCSYGVYSHGPNSSNQISDSIFNRDPYAVYITNCHDCQVTNNQIAEGYWAIYDDSGTNEVISGNQIIGPQSAGIFPSGGRKAYGHKEHCDRYRLRLLRSGCFRQQHLQQ